MNTEPKARKATPEEAKHLRGFIVCLRGHKFSETWDMSKQTLEQYFKYFLSIFKDDIEELRICQYAPNFEVQHINKLHSLITKYRDSLP